MAMATARIPGMTTSLRPTASRVALVFFILGFWSRGHAVTPVAATSIGTNAGGPLTKATSPWSLVNVAAMNWIPASYQGMRRVSTTLRTRIV